MASNLRAGRLVVGTGTAPTGPARVCSLLSARGAAVTSALRELTTSAHLQLRKRGPLLRVPLEQPVQVVVQAAAPALPRLPRGGGLAGGLSRAGWRVSSVGALAASNGFFLVQVPIAQH